MSRCLDNCLSQSQFEKNHEAISFSNSIFFQNIGLCKCNSFHTHLAPSNFFLFSKLKIHLKSKRYLDEENIFTPCAKESIRGTLTKGK